MCVYGCVCLCVFVYYSTDGTEYWLHCEQACSITGLVPVIQNLTQVWLDLPNQIILTGISSVALWPFMLLLVRHFSLCLHAVTGEAFQLLNLKGACTKAVPKSFIFPDEKKLYFKSIHGWNSRRISFHLAVHLVSSFWVKNKKTKWVDVSITVSRKDTRCQNWRQVNSKQQPLGLKKPTHKCQKLQFFYSRWL